MQLAPLYPVIHRLIHPFFPCCLWSGHPGSNTIALTFDDGPHPQFTPDLLAVLDRRQVTASFFLLGTCVQRAPETARMIYQRGHWLGLHGFQHRGFHQLTASELKQSLEQTQVAIAQACHLPIVEVQQRVRDVRPPNGLFTPQVLENLCRWNYRPVMWSVVPEDWVRPGIDVAVQRILQQTQNGSLIVLHDGYCGGEDVAAIADQLIPKLQQQGYQFVSVEELWQARLKN